MQSGWSALHTATWNGYTDLCSVLLKSGADPDICGPSGVTPLCLAAQQGHADVVRQLIEASCNVRCLADIDGSRSVTPLHLAARNGHGDVVRLLVAAGVDVEAPMTSSGVCGLTALHLAVESGHLDIIDVLLDAGSNVNSETLSAMESTCWDYGPEKTSRLACRRVGHPIRVQVQTSNVVWAKFLEQASHSAGKSRRVRELKKSGKSRNFVCDLGKIACITRFGNCCWNIVSGQKHDIVSAIRFVLRILLFLNWKCLRTYVYRS